LFLFFRWEQPYTFSDVFWTHNDRADDGTDISDVGNNEGDSISSDNDLSFNLDDVLILFEIH
jgi:hypothetical protein